MPKNKLLKTIINTTVLVALSSSAQAATMKVDPLQIENKMEKCAGVVKAGVSDCATVEHACAGLNDEDNLPNEFLWVLKGSCSKIVGAHLLKNTKI